MSHFSPHGIKKFRSEVSKFTFRKMMLKTENKKILRKRVDEDIKGMSEIRLGKG